MCPEEAQKREQETEVRAERLEKRYADQMNNGMITTTQL